MVTDITYDEFCKKYYDDARKIADIAVARYIAKYGQQDNSIDLGLVKDESIEKSLKKTYETYDPNNESKASVRTYLSRIIHRQVSDEVGREKQVDRTKSTLPIDKAKDECVSEEEDGKTADTKLLRDHINRLDSEDKIILECFGLYGRRSYAEEALKRLGWDESKRSLVLTRKKRALETIKRDMAKRSEEVVANEEPSGDVPFNYQPSKVIYKYNEPLAKIKPYVEIIKRYFGLNHPNLDWELLLLDDDPEREFELVAFIPYDDIKKALIDASFNMGEDVEEYTRLLWTVANLYYGDSYQRYEEAAMEEADDYLRWNCIKEDIVRLYAFMDGHKTEEHIIIKVGQESVELANPFKWFQSLLDNHLFPNCIPDIKDVKQANQILVKSRGRKIDNKVATAIVNGVATYFKEKGLIAARAPKNLCSFLWKFLVMMKLKDASDYLFTEASIKNWINNIQGQKDDPKIYTPEIRKVSIEELNEIPLYVRADRWLFHPKH